MKKSQCGFLPEKNVGKKRIFPILNLAAVVKQHQQT